MAEKKVILPMVQNEKKTISDNTNTGCNGCGSKSCKGGGMGIYPGSEKEIVYRNVFLYTIMGLIIFITAYLIIHLLNQFIS
ncbi:MAG: hypothetical protein WBL02_09160 [Methanomethylovorans sp.]|uniref:hypothetical protein n=1 Tax=Methanomethylovorans sp. TaxID=2758717 RepID=UPI001BD60A40|nr:hypothetical protein [Methanomethylovorans sp.]